MKVRLFRSMFLAIVGIAVICWPAAANIVNVDLSGAVTGTLVTGVGASFAETFAGQSVSVATLTGSPTNPLTLSPSGTLEVAYWDPIVSPGANSILPEPGNQGPLSVLLDSNADSVTWTMGSADAVNPVSINFYNASGALVHSVSQSLTLGYSVYTLSGFGDFRGFTIFNNTDPAGLRFENFSYNAITGPVPEPSTTLLLVLTLAPAVFLIARKRHA